jgi:hypothetical protein
MRLLHQNTFCAAAWEENEIKKFKVSCPVAKLMTD